MLLNSKLSPGVPNLENRKVGRFITFINKTTKTDLDNWVGFHEPRLTDLDN